jgi:LEA14-like dessication related protein
MVDGGSLRSQWEVRSEEWEVVGRYAAIYSPFPFPIPVSRARSANHLFAIIPKIF